MAYGFDASANDAESGRLVSGDSWSGDDVIGVGR